MTKQEETKKGIELNLIDISFAYLCKLYGKDYVLKCNKEYFGADTRAYNEFLGRIGSK